MTVRFAKVVYGLLAALMIAAVGCERHADRLAQASIIDEARYASMGLSDFAAAIQAAGGRRAWLDTKRFDLQCITALYDAAGAYYLTEQDYSVFPWSHTIRISGREPEGQYLWQFERDSFSVVQGPAGFAAGGAVLQPRELAQAVLTLVAAPARIVDPSLTFQRRQPVRMDGTWYHPINVQQTDPAGEKPPQASKVVFYQNADTSLIDIVQLAPQPGAMLTVRGYNYRTPEKAAVLLPARIEIFKTDPAGNILHRLARIDFKGR